MISTNQSKASTSTNESGAVCLEERDVEETVDHTNTDHQRPLRAPEIVDPTAVLNPQNLQAAIRTCERLKVKILLFT